MLHNGERGREKDTALVRNKHTIYKGTQIIKAKEHLIKRELKCTGFNKRKSMQTADWIFLQMRKDSSQEWHLNWDSKGERGGA